MQRPVLGLILVAVLLCDGWFAIPSPVALAASLEEKKEAEEQKAASLAGEKNTLEEAVDALNTDLAAISEDLEKAETAILDKQTAIAETKASLSLAEEKARKQYAAMKLRIQYMYENGNQLFLIMLLESDGISDFLIRSDQIESITAYDRQMLLSYLATKKEIAAAKKTLEEEETELVALREELVEKETELEASIAATSEKIAAYESEIAAAQAKAQTYEEELEKQKEAAAQAERARMAAGGNDTANPGSGASGNQNAASTSSSGTQNPSYASSGSDMDMMAAIIFCEAGNQIMQGKIAVGAVVLNRMRSPRFPNSLSGVLYQRSQFSPVGSGRFATVLASGKATSECYEAARRAFNGEDPTGGCLFFHRANGAPGLVIQDHVFY